MRLAKTLGSAWDKVNAAHLRIVRDAVKQHGGVTVRTEGDALFAAFPEAGAAVRAAVDAQRALIEHAWPKHGSPRVRMGLHSGEAHRSGDDYGGFEVNRAARIAAVAHGGQIVVSAPTRALVAEALPPGAFLRDLGEHALKDVEQPERLYQLDAPGLPTSFPPPRTREVRRGNVPNRLTSFIGRASDLAQLGALLESSRLVTLTGPGGIGKTSLAIELARSQAARFPDGAWLVSLDVIDERSQVRSTIARTIGLYDGPERSAAAGLLPYLAERSMLLVLDNFEHVLDASGEVTAMLEASPESRVIVTSRAPLRTSGEQEYPVRPLLHSGGAEPNATSADDAFRLFVDRARAVRPDWQPDGRAPVVHEICRLLDGLPLGIELAAARIALLPVEAIRDRLRAGIALPGSGPRDAPARQRTLESAIGWSYGLLSADQQSLLARVSVFEGSFDADQAAAVASPSNRPSEDVLEGLMSLCEQSLLIPELDTRGEAIAGAGVRVRMLKTIGSFAAERLGESGDEPAVRRLHALAYLDLAEAAAQHLRGPDQPHWLDRLGLDHANLRTALRWAIDSHETEVALRFLPALWRYWQLDGHLHEGRALADAALSLPTADAPTTTRMWAVAAGGNLAYWQGDSASARRRYEEELEIARQRQDPVGEADAVFNIAHVVFIEAGDPPLMASHLVDARSRYEAIGDARGVARCDWGLANTMLVRGRVDEAMASFRELLARFDALGDGQYHAMAASSLGWATYAQGDKQGGARWTIRGLVESHKTRDAATTTISLQEAAMVAMILKRPEVAAMLMGAFESLCQRYGVRPPMSLERFLSGLDVLPELRDALDSDRLEGAIDRGRRMTLDEAVALVVELGDTLDEGSVD